jgi:hypothetical protein
MGGLTLKFKCASVPEALQKCKPMLNKQAGVRVKNVLKS